MPAHGLKWIPIRAIGFVVGIGAIVANAAAWHYYEASGAESREALQAANLRSMQNAGQHEVNKAQSAMVIERTMREIQTALPQHANRAAARNADQFAQERFREQEPVPLSQNGHRE